MQCCQFVLLYYLYMWMMKMVEFIGEICNDLFYFIVGEFQSNIIKKGNFNMELV